MGCSDLVRTQKHRFKEAAKDECESVSITRMD